MKPLSFAAIIFIVLCIAVVEGTQNSSYHDRVIYVHKRKGKDREQCMEGYRGTNEIGLQRCKTLEFVANQLSNGSQNITIILESKLTIRSRVTFKDAELFTFRSNSKSETLTCNCNTGTKDQGLSFMYIDKVMISGITISQCCGVKSAHSATIWVHECSDVMMESLIVHYNRISSGAILMNPSGTVSIQRSKFSNNGYKGLVPNDQSFAGGMHIQFSKHNSTNNTANITIFNCKFEQNTTPDLKFHKSYRFNGIEWQ